MTTSFGPIPGAVVAPRLTLRELAALLGRSTLATGVDTGLAHLATALRVPTIALYVTTDPALTGVTGVGYGTWRQLQLRRGTHLPN